MQREISPLVHPLNLLSLKQATDIVLIDARAGQEAKARYIMNHLEGALHVDADMQLADIKSDLSNGGRHPLPSPEQFSKVLSELGIAPDSHVIVYDANTGAGAAARFWWMLKAVGHQKVQVIDGGMDAAVKAGFPVSAKTENPVLTELYPTGKWLLPVAGLEHVATAVQNETFLVIDVRDKQRYDGEKEPIDPVAGHIPGSINIPYMDNLDNDGCYLSPDLLRAKYLQAINNRPPENVMVHCGSGITACNTLLAMAYAGLTIPVLYVGSWSEWCRNNRPVATIMKA